MASGFLAARITQLTELISKEGWGIYAQKEIPYGQQVEVTDGKNRQQVNLYDSGKIVVQGKDSPLRVALKSWAADLASTSSDSALSSSPNIISSSRPGVDPAYIDFPGYVELFTSLEQIGLEAISTSRIDYGIVIKVTDGTFRANVNLYSSGKIVIGGKASVLKQRLEELHQSIVLPTIAPVEAAGSATGRTAKYLVIPSKVEEIRTSLLSNWGDAGRETLADGAAETYRIEISSDISKVTVTQYQSGSLVVQGRSSFLFEDVCSFLDTLLVQSFSARAERYLPDNTDTTVKTYLDQPTTENSALQWLDEHVEFDALVREFLPPTDRATIIAGAALCIAAERGMFTLPDYSVVVMPFGKAFEGYLTALAIHLGLTTRAEVDKRLSAVDIGSDSGWISEISKRLPDPRRHADTPTSLKSAWHCRNKAMHSDSAHPNSTLPTFQKAKREIDVILRAMEKSYQLFILGDLKLQDDNQRTSSLSKASDRKKGDEFKYHGVDRESLLRQLQADPNYEIVVNEPTKKNAWEINSTSGIRVFAPRDSDTVVVRGNDRDAFVAKYAGFLSSKAIVVGVDESGKGDVFGPLVIAAVATDQDTEKALIAAGVRDSKTLDDRDVRILSERIRTTCQYEILVLRPSEYNERYLEYDNLNSLLAWGHAEVVKRLAKRTKLTKCISDQFAGSHDVLKSAFGNHGITVPLEQRHGAESETSVAAASIIARDAFIQEMDKLSKEAGFSLPKGGSNPDIAGALQRIIRGKGKQGLSQFAKLHFKPVREALGA